MRLITLALLSSMTVLLSGFGTYSGGEIAEEHQISFSLAYKYTTGENGENTQPCLADSHTSGLKVVLLSKDAKCSATTGKTFIPNWGGADAFKATRLKGTEKCLTVFRDGPNGSLRETTRVAVLGVDASVVRAIKSKKDETPLSEEIESKARKIASSAYQKSFRNSKGLAVDVADSPPDVFGVGNTAFLLFECTGGEYAGLPVMVLKNKAFLLEGSCVSNPPFFFSVKENLYVSYWATCGCCGCGASVFFVYDVSGKSPKQVYSNGNFAN
jgi:hypothetical protein